MSDTQQRSTLELRRDNWSETRIVHEPIPDDLAADEVLFRVNRFALTANNISYCVGGDMLGYWGFFPTQEGWGRVPVMGYADVVASQHPDIAVGERVWGFFPMSTHLKIKAGKVHPGQLVDVSPHRAEYAPVYAQYQRTKANPIYQADREDQDSLLRGLFLTSWLCEDYVHDNAMFGGDHYVITSASSKTSIALASVVKQRGSAPCIGLTSKGNVAFCEALGCYDRVLSYDDIDQLDASRGAVLVDMAGNADLIARVHTHYGDNLRFSSKIGATHHDDLGPTDNLPGAVPEFFFAPAQAQKRTGDWGPGEIEKRMGASFMAFREFCDSWLTVERHYGEAAAANTYQRVLQGQVAPAEGCIVSLWPSEPG
jgi:NADPH:quinone reductase-like Zn-dependent oxidoreductase